MNQEQIFEVLDKTKPLYIVSLIGKQTIPNILLIKYLQKKYTDIHSILIYTKDEETAKDIIVDFFKENCKSIPFCVDAIIYDDIVKMLNEKLDGIVKQTYNIIFNITGGTKAMTCALFYYAKKHNLENNICYIYRDKLYLFFSNVSSMKKGYEFQEMMTLEEYFTAVMLKTPIEKLSKGQSPNNYENEQKNIILYTPINNEDSVNFFASKALLDNIFLTNLKKIIGKEKKKYVSNLFTNNHCIPPKDYVHFVSCGEWFEEYIYNNISVKGQIDKKNISLNIEYRTGNAKSKEVDICFIHNNNIYLIECKVFVNEKETMQSVDKLITFGQSVGSHATLIFITTKFGFDKISIANPDNRSNIENRIKKNIKDRGIKFIQLESAQDNILDLILKKDNEKVI